LEFTSSVARRVQVLEVPLNCAQGLFAEARRYPALIRLSETLFSQVPFVPVARLTLRPQSAWNETRSVEMDDGLSFSPWHGLAAHRAERRHGHGLKHRAVRPWPVGC
jgi:hypothetical protein